MNWTWMWPFGVTSRNSDATSDGMFTTKERTVIECGVKHACGGRCFMYDMNRTWIHHCGGPAVCDYAAHQKCYDEKVSIMRERKAD